MKYLQLKQLKALNFISFAVAFLLWLCYFFYFSGNEWLTSGWENFVAKVTVLFSVLMAFFSLIISVKTGSQKGSLLVGLFLSLFSQNIAISHMLRFHDSRILFIAIFISNALAGTVFLKAFQSFPKQLTNHDIETVFKKNKILKRLLRWAIKGYTWFLFFLFILAGIIVSVFTGVLIPTNFIILIIGFLCLFVNYRTSSVSEMNKILWLFWGIMVDIFIVFIAQTITYFNGGISQSLDNVGVFLQTMVMIVSLIMSLFFFDTFNTGLIITRTITDSIIFILIVIVYNTTEHYFLHWLSHELHLSDVLVSSLLSGIFVMLFSPVHHKLMHFLEKRVKRFPVPHT